MCLESQLNTLKLHPGDESSILLDHLLDRQEATIQTLQYNQCRWVYQ